MVMCFLCNTLTTIVGVFVYSHYLFINLLGMEREITYDDVLMFIVKNKDNVEIMDDLNRTVYPFTSRYRNRVEQKINVEKLENSNCKILSPNQDK